MVAEPLEAVVSGAPFVGVEQSGGRVTVRSAGVTVSARRVVLALPARWGVRFDPALQADHALLIEQAPAGTEVTVDPGRSMGHSPVGVLTQLGRRLREPVGWLRRAGGETATTS